MIDVLLFLSLGLVKFADAVVRVPVVGERVQQAVQRLFVLFEVEKRDGHFGGSDHSIGGMVAVAAEEREFGGNW
jgi:hypothetical protein